MNKYEVLKVVGEGAYGIVYKCRNKESNELVAIKKFKEVHDEIVRKTMARELKVLQILKNEYIVEYKGAFKRKENLYLVFEYVEKNLLELLQEHSKGLDPNLIKKIIYQLCKSINYLHSQNIVHRDIKPENLLISNNNYKLKLCDFGFARNINNISNNNDINNKKLKNEILTDYVATRWYRSPELLLSAGEYGYEVDNWAIGCIMGELTDGEPLFPGDNEIDQLMTIQKVLGKFSDKQYELFNTNPHFKGYKLGEVSKPETLERRYMGKLSKQAISFMKELLNPDPKLRLKGENMLKHSYFENYGDNQTKNSNNVNSITIEKRSIIDSKEKDIKFVQQELLKNKTNKNSMDMVYNKDAKDISKKIAKNINIVTENNIENLNKNLNNNENLNINITNKSINLSKENPYKKTNSNSKEKNITNINCNNAINSTNNIYRNNLNHNIIAQKCNKNDYNEKISNNANNNYDFNTPKQIVTNTTNINIINFNHYESKLEKFEKMEKEKNKKFTNTINNFYKPDFSFSNSNSLSKGKNNNNNLNVNNSNYNLLNINTSLNNFNNNNANNLNNYSNFSNNLNNKNYKLKNKSKNKSIQDSLIVTSNNFSKNNKDSINYINGNISNNTVDSNFKTFYTKDNKYNYDIDCNYKKDEIKQKSKVFNKFSNKINKKYNIKNNYIIPEESFYVSNNSNSPQKKSNYKNNFLNYKISPPKVNNYSIMNSNYKTKASFYNNSIQLPSICNNYNVNAFNKINNFKKILK